MKHVGIFVKRNKTEAGEAAKSLINWLKQRDLEALIPDTEAEMYGIPGGQPVEEVLEKSDLLVVLGGDGTFLAASRLLKGRQVPVLGVNLGGMGFLTEVRLNDLPKTLDKLLADDMRIVERMRLNVTLHTNGEEIPFAVLNDVVVSKSALARIFDLRITVGGNFLNTVRADGLIVATPTGSTAYNLAAGGPVVHPQTNAIIITPINPHMLTNRPLVVPAERNVEIELVDEAEVYVTFDGQVGRELRFGDRVVIEASAKPLLMIKSQERSYFDVLREKLHYGER
ncbi:MAG: NAD(+)/NADH kinase [Alphaproteobacteria bacterium]